MKKDDITDAKSVVRLLKLLSSCPDHKALSEEGESAWQIKSADRGYKFRKEVVQTCEKLTLIQRKDRHLQITDTGIAHMKRALHPEEPFQRQNRQVVATTIRTPCGQMQVERNDSESPLLRLFTRKEKAGRTWLSESQYRAGERLRADFERSRLQPRITANWEASVASGRRDGGGSEISDFALDARKKVDEAVSALGPELSEVALDICCFLKGLEHVERERGWPQRSAKLLLRTALAVLARHYGIETAHRLQDQMSIRTWAAEDYRPSI